MQRSFLLQLLSILVLAASCSPKYLKQSGNYPFLKSGIPDYSDQNYWAAHPYKYDLSDSVPTPLRKTYQYDSSVDVFFLHPTTYTQKQAKTWNADLSDANLNARTDYSTILYQGSVFNEYRVFSPRYRQAHLRSYYTNELAAFAAFDTAYADIRNAFIYYLANLNSDRPIIIASHSQGTTHAMRLLKEFFEEKPLARKLVAAYLVGMFIPDTLFTSLPVCSDSLQTGCYCGWRSFETNYVAAYVEKENESSVVTNPLTWSTGPEHAAKNLNKGSVLRNFNKIYYGVADAKLQKGVVWINNPQFPGSAFIRMKNYHIADINFFYMNIRENLRQRVAAFKRRAAAIN